MKNAVIAVAVAVAGITVLTVSGPVLRAWYNGWHYIDMKVDEATSYELKKEVEDTCRSMIASYEQDKLTYEQYKDGTKEQRGWADQAKMRANGTVTKYNEYVMKNSYVWKDNVPADIKVKLEAVE